MGREEGGGFRMRNTCMPVADSFRYMTELINIVKFKNKDKKRYFYYSMKHFSDSVNAYDK